MRFFNSWSRKLEEFRPLEENRPRIYACGPTVYDQAHIGNFRFNVWVDILRRTLEWKGYDVTLVMNITDVDDNTIAGALRTGEALEAFTARYTEVFFEDLETLRIRPATVYPRATQHIGEMIELVEKLLAKRLAYRKDGAVYFRVGDYPDYGRLSRLDPDQLRSTGRIEGDAYEKEDVRDFALWKAAKEGEPSWETPWGRGRPGWHLECSAMSVKYLGENFDAHLGGVDLIFPHHENEIAQSVGATGEGFARMWLHCAHLVVDGAKMSKSLGNQYTLRDLLEAGHDPASIRYLLSSVHYRKQLNFTKAALVQAKAAVTRLAELVARLEQALPRLPEGDESERGTIAGRALENARAGFALALANDLNTSGALGHMFSLVKAAHTALDNHRIDQGTATSVLEWLREVDQIWALLPSAEKPIEHTTEVDGVRLVAIGPEIPGHLAELVVARMEARALGDFTQADALRARLAEAGIVLEDTAQGVRWHIGAAPAKT